MIGEDNIHIIEKGVVQELTLVIYLTLMFQTQKKHYQYKAKVFCLRDRTQTIQSHMSGNQNTLFFQEELHS